MKVLIHDEETGLYLAHQDRWTDNLREARDFAFSIHASAVARNLRLKKFQVFFYFPDLDYKISVYASQEKALA
jgi:hypothetical protein